jgi:UDP-N-acetylglucosamine 2-epimerase (non-hydrolysing)
VLHWRILEGPCWPERRDIFWTRFLLDNPIEAGMANRLKLVHIIAAARPNFMKIAPLYHALKATDWAEPIIVHTGQHYDLNMSDSFFQDLMLPKPHVHLGVSSGTHAEQTGRVMIEYEKIILQQPPDLAVVVGDVNSTMAAAIAGVKTQVKIAHLEAGLRSFDRSMPEEINRILTDSISDLLWTPSSDGDENLLREGVAAERIVRVGNIMIDSLEMMRGVIEKENSLAKYGFRPGGYALVTLHRPSNVDSGANLENIVKTLVRISNRIPLFFPIHPRTRKNLEINGLIDRIEAAGNIWIEQPLGYVAFMSLLFTCRMAITDSGGIQEEATYLGIPCLTMRPNTERPITIAQGTNRLCSLENVESHVTEILTRTPAVNKLPDLWDGRTATRVVESIKKFLNVA